MVLIGFDELLLGYNELLLQLGDKELLISQLLN